MQVDSLFTAIDSLKLPAAVVIVGALLYYKVQSLEKRVHEINIQKEDKTVVAQLVQDYKGLSGRQNDAAKKADQRFRVHELTILALAPKEEKHHVIADLKGD